MCPKWSKMLKNSIGGTSFKSTFFFPLFPPLFDHGRRHLTQKKRREEEEEEMEEEENEKKEEENEKKEEEEKE